MQLLALLAYTGVTLAAPAPEAGPEPTAAPILDDRGLLGTILNFGQLSSQLASLSAGPASALPSGYASILSAIQPSATPANAAAAASRLQMAQAAFPSNPLGAGASLLLSGVTGESAFGDPIAVCSFLLSI